jgi:chromosomal replication initiation ATPase DnaA
MEPTSPKPRGLDSDARDTLDGVSRAFAVTADEIESKCRTWRVVQPRFAWYTILRNMGYTLCEIAYVAGRTHGAVHNGIKQFKARVAIEKDLSRSLAELRERGWTL